jgi:UrcA family protein
MRIKGNRSKAFAIGLALVTYSAVLPATVFAASQLEEITVEGSRLTKDVVGRSSSTGTPIELVTLTRHVNYSDLDLRTHSGAIALQKRVNLTAKAACDELDKIFPLTKSSDSGRSCVNGATKAAMVQAQAAIEAAEATHASAQ